MTIVEPSIPLLEAIPLLLLVVVLLNHLEHLEEVLRDLVMTVILQTLAVLVGEEAAVGLLDVRLMTVMTVHELPLSKPWRMPSSCRLRAAGKTLLSPLYPRRTPSWPGEIKSKRMSLVSPALATRARLDPSGS